MKPVGLHQAGFGDQRLHAEGYQPNIMLGGNIERVTRNIPTAIALETSKGEYAQGIALGIVLMALAVLLNFSLSVLHGRGGGMR